MYSKLIFFISLFIISFQANAQLDSILSKIDFEMDYRFRAEQDWNSLQSNGTLRDNRSRLRYRVRTGLTYKNNWYSFGFRIRTGNPNKQQDPQLTLGKGFKEFGTLPIGFEKAFFQIEKNNYKIWLGKNTFPFEKNNELFWSDNVYPEGLFLEKSFNSNSNLFNKIKLTGGHFIIASNNNSLLNDAYLQGIQSSITSKNERIKIFPSLYFLRNIPNIPDGNHSFLLDYTIFHFGSNFYPIKNKDFNINFDYYSNIEDYSQNKNITPNLLDQKSGFSVGIQYGKNKTKKDWLVKLTYAHLERFSILDFMAQNDWARWDYSSDNSPDGRLSNFQGAEFVLAYSLTDKIKLVSKYYIVKQLVALGTTKETGQRIRFDIDIKL